MSDYINRQAAIDALWKLRRQYQLLDDTQTADKIMHGLYRAEQALTELSSTEVAPVRHGRWVPHPTDREWDVCTACGIGFHRRHYGLNDDGTEWVEEDNAPYCLNCGARMDGEQDG